MRRVLATVLALLAIFHYGQCLTNGVKYRAAVVEYRNVPDGANTILRNVQNYVDEIEKNNVDIIVFPEYGLTSLEVFNKTNWKNDYTLYVPKSYEDTILCSETNHVEVALKDISCVAKRKGTYVVINFLEKDNSTTNELFYNTNLVFDKEGKIVAKYRKINLYAEDELTPGKDIVTFQTDFNVKFGIFTCYDILFKYPAADILTDDVYDIIYPTAWISQTPFGISLSVQAGYAKKNKVNLLASNYNNPAESNGGSGIYIGTGFTYTAHISGQHTSKTISLSDIESILRPKKCEDERSGSKPDLVGINSRGVGTIPTLNDYFTQATSTEGDVNIFKALSVGESEFDGEICDNSLCCKFEAKTLDKLSPYNGVYKWTLSKKDGAISCALLFCKTNEDSSCGDRIDQSTNTSFIAISVKGNFPKKQYTLPITSHVDLQPMYPSYSYCAKDTDSNNEDIIMQIYQDIHKDVTAYGIVGYLKGDSVALCCNTIIVTLLGLYAIFRNYI